MRKLTVVTSCFWFLTAPCPRSAAQPQTLEAAVVKVTSQSDDVRKTGTGLIVRLDADRAYLVTAAHVVEGDAEPKVEFFTKRNALVVATIAGLEGGDPRGLALLVVSGAANLPSGLAALPLASSPDVQGGEAITAIGFPRMAGPWSILRGSVVSRQGRDIVFDAAIDEGNSGGPLIKDGHLVGLITGVAGRYGRATPAESVRLFLEGWGVRLEGPSPSLAAGRPGQPANAKAAELLVIAKLRYENADFKGAWRLAQQAVEIDPNPAVLRFQAQVAMTWVRELAVAEKETFGTVVDQVQEVLYRGTTGTDPVLAADCFAHIGWGNFLKQRDRYGISAGRVVNSELQIEANYRRAVEKDPGNPYARVMWGHFVLWKDPDNLEDAKRHFASALSSGREREYVRQLQLAALRNVSNVESAVETIRVADDIRKKGEPLEPSVKWGMGAGVYDMHRRELLERLSSILPAADHLATYQWLIRDVKEMSPLHHFWVARLTEATGDHRAALSQYRSIQARYRGYTLTRDLDEAIKRCVAAIGNPR